MYTRASILIYAKWKNLINIRYIVFDNLIIFEFFTCVSFLNDLVPLGGMRNELGKILFPELRQIRSELQEHLRNRNAYLDAVDPERALDKVVDPIDGKEIGSEDNWFLRVFNRGPVKVHSRPSKEFP